MQGVCCQNEGMRIQKLQTPSKRMIELRPSGSTKVDGIGPESGPVAPERNEARGSGARPVRGTERLTPLAPVVAAHARNAKHLNERLEAPHILLLLSTRCFHELLEKIPDQFFYCPHVAHMVTNRLRWPYRLQR